MKFKRRKSERLSGGVCVIFEEELDASDDGSIQPFQIIASSAGVTFDGLSSTLESRAELDQFAKAVADAWKEHEALKPKILRSLAGH